MRRLLLIAGAAALVAAALVAVAPAEAANVQLMVVGKDRLLREANKVRLKPRLVTVGSRRCKVARRTPLAALAATKLRLTIRDYGACSRRPRDAGGLYVRAIRGERERGNGGWVYKVGHRAGTAGAADVTGRKLRAGRRVTWFWCELEPSGSCQRTLAVTPERPAAAPGAALGVTVRGYDDFGRGEPVAGATVRLGTATAVTGADGAAVLTVPAGTGRLRLEAEHPGMVRAFPEMVRVG